MSCSYERKAGHDDFPGKPEGPDGNLQGYGSVAGGNAIINPQQVGDAPLELLYVRAIVAQPPSLQHIVEVVKWEMSTNDVWATSMQGSRESATAA